jgi:uncharacterized protein YlxP (DUF503 family)
MFSALIEIDLHVPAATNLKAKRAVVKSLLARLRNDLNCSAAEVGHQDLWQRVLLGVAVVSGTESGARKVAQQVEKVVSRETRVEIIAFDVDVVGLDR